MAVLYIVYYVVALDAHGAGYHRHDLLDELNLSRENSEELGRNTIKRLPIRQLSLSPNPVSRFSLDLGKSATHSEPNPRF